MKRLNILTYSATIMVASMALILPTLLTTSFGAERVALLIGNNDYPEDGLFSDLANPKNDVALIAKSLIKRDFDVILVEDASYTEMKMKLNEFEDLIEPGGTALFYFAGHGVQYDGENYLLATNAKFLKKYELGDESLKADTVLQALSGKRPKSALMFLDCCRESPPKSWMSSDTRGSRSRGLSNMQHPDVVISFSAAPDAPAMDGETNNSPFAASLSQQILTGEELFPVLRAVANDVQDATGRAQRPWWNGSLLHPFYFDPKGAPREAVKVGNGGVSVQTNLVDSGEEMQVGSGKILNESEISAAVVEAETFTPMLPMELPSRGYFSNEEVFEGGSYHGYNYSSQKSIVKEAQGKLPDAGYADGKMGRNTQASLIAYQEENSLSVTGRLDQETLTAMSLLGRKEIASSSSSGGSTRGYNSGRSSSSNRSGGNINRAIDNAYKINSIIRSFR